jgi:hypothetical protein
MTISKIAALFVSIALLSVAALAQVANTPQGRLSLSSTAAVMTADVTNGTAIYYLPYMGPFVPIRVDNSGSYTWSNWAVAPMTLTLNSTQQTTGNIYDIFAFSFVGSGPFIGIGPAWASSTSRGSSGTSTAIQESSLEGLWVNVNALTLYNGTTSYSVGVGNGTYLGSVFMTGNGETSVNIKPTAASGGTNNVIGIWNAYNRVPITSVCRDSSNAWLDSSTSWEKADTSSSNTVSWVDGLQQTSVIGRYTTVAIPNTNDATAFVGVDLDSGSATPTLVSEALFGGTSTASYGTLAVEEAFPPQMGAHYVQAMQNVAGTSPTVTFDGTYAYGFEALTLTSEY